MNGKVSLGFFLSVILMVSSATQLVRYKYFDEYLIHMERRQQTILFEEIEVRIADSLPFRAGYKFSKDEKCCMLGNLAGEKGFHCFAPFYVKRIRSRNYNRAHNKKIVSLLKGKSNPAAEKLMRTFEQCVDYRGNIFNKCCRYVALNTI